LDGLANRASGLYSLNAERWMTLEEVEKIADVIETCQEVDMDRDAAILMVDLFSTAFPEFEWDIDCTNGKVKIEHKG
jgi:hypothetical protein